MVTMAVTANNVHTADAGADVFGSVFFKRVPLAVACSLFMATGAHAADWRFTPSVAGSAIYTDNANQSESDPEDALILTLTPGFSLQSEGSRRVKASMNYNLTGVQRFSENDSSDLYHNLGAAGNAELVEDLLYLDGRASISQELISLFGSPADATINDTNRATVGAYTISPYLQRRLGSFADAYARYTTGGALFSDNAASNSAIDMFTASLTSGTRFTNLSWGLDYSFRRSDNDDTGTSTFERATATLGYALTRHFRVFGTYGDEQNDFLGASNADGTSYSLGFDWSPSRRTNIGATIGERYFGRTYSFSGNHRAQRSTWSVSYTEDFNDISLSVTNYDDLQSVRFTCPAGAALPAKPSLIDYFNANCVISGATFGSSIVNGIFISKLLTAGVTWQLKRTDISLTLSDLTREFQLAGTEDRVQRAMGSISYRLNPRDRASGSLLFTRSSDDAASGREDDLLSLSLGLSHEFSEDLSGALTYRHQQRDSNIANSDFDENSLTALFSMRF
ncbi:TIGR03016 family PEP-CTERM system-associated outer membrane protein [Thiobacillus sp.]|uniref:TIGR03016 family PEP-CTERM system-associated outer membrane protein n=1 Tax=Thiobacillus sp. TaxID=924 RepID=UPI00286E2DEF|nr:TIGR03016 family PEP-CTERM system-associated outer membrane protein [Thiobacillus sp.]